MSLQPRSSPRWSIRRQLILLAVLFAASRGLYWLLGVRFDDSSLGVFWQLLDPELLSHDLGRSLFYLHSQPPLFNLLLGGVLKLSPWPVGGVFHAFFLLLGYFCFAGSFLLMRRLGIRALVALPVASILVMRPSFVLLENLLMYDLPVAALLVAAVLGLDRALARSSESAGSEANSESQPWGLFFWILLVLCGTRSLFHPIFFGAALLTLIWMSRRPLGGHLGLRAPLIWRAAMVPLLLLGVWQVKNWAVFGHGGYSSWLGMNAARIVGAGLSAEQLSNLHDRGLVSEVFFVPPFSSILDYPERFRRADVLDAGLGRQAAEAEVAALTAVKKSTGATNFNHFAYLAISSQYLADARSVVWFQPKAYFHGMAKAWYNYLQPASRLDHLRGNRDRLGPWVEGFEALLYGEIPEGFRYGGEPRSLFVLPLIFFPTWIGFGLWLCRKGSGQSATDRVVIVFMGATILYVAMVGNSLEVWENQRFRFYTDAFLAVLAALMIERAIRWAGGERGSTRSETVELEGRSVEHGLEELRGQMSVRREGAGIRSDE